MNCFQTLANLASYWRFWTELFPIFCIVQGV